MTRTPNQRVAYLVNAFPVVSEAFLVNEIRGVESEGVPVTIMTLSNKSDEVQPAGTESIRADLIRPPALLPLGWLWIAWAHISVLVCRPVAYLRLVRDDVGFPLWRFVQNCRESRSFSGLRKRWRLFMLAPLIAYRAKKSGVDHFHAHYAKGPLEVAARASWLTGVTYSFAAHAKDLYTTPGDRLARRLAKAKFAITCHPHGLRTLRSLALSDRDRRKVQLIPHGLDLSIFSPGDVAREPGLIVAAGRLTPKKGFDVLINACARLVGRDGFRCVILGAGRLQSRLERLIEKRGLAERVSIMRFVDQRELARWFQRAAVVVVPGRVLKSGNRDGVPNVMVEAMACGTPVVATRVGSIDRTIEDGVTGRLIPASDVKALSAALSKCLDSPEKALRMADRARVLTESMDFRESSKRVARLFRRRLARAKSPDLVGQEIGSDRQARLIRAAVRQLGREPRLRPEVETAIARSVTSGLGANSWRTDIGRMLERRLWDEVAKTSRVRELLRMSQNRGVQLGPTTRVLDVGCGRGGVSVALMARQIPVVALDLRVRNCHVARLRGQRYQLSVPAVGARAESLPFGDSHFDVVCLFEVLEHVGDPHGLLSEARRVCRPAGLTVVTVVNRWAHFDPHYHLWGINFLPRSVAERLIKAMGRSKRSWQDRQKLADMHYFSYGAFEQFANQIGFVVHDTVGSHGRLGRLTHQLGRSLSVGFNTVTLILEPS